MRRLCEPVLGCLLVGLWASGATAQRPAPGVPVALEEPRPYPVLPAALVPFVLASEVCQRGHVPVVGMTVYNVLAQPVAILHLRTRRAEALDSLRMRCGTYVATWNGTIDQGTRVAPPGIYYLQLTVDGRRPSTRKLVVPQP